MSLNNSRGRLVGLSRELLKEWRTTEEVWRDRKRHEFDRDYMQPLFDAVDTAAVAIEDLDKLLRKLRDDCETE